MKKKEKLQQEQKQDKLLYVNSVSYLPFCTGQDVQGGNGNRT